MPKKQTAEQVAAARRRTTKAPGLIVREKELASAKRELSTVRDTGVASKLQTAKLVEGVASAQRALNRQVETARRQGRPTS